MKYKIQNFRTKTIVLATFCIVFLSLFTVSCSKPENGKDGAAGTANVFYSEWATVAFTGTVPNLMGQIIAPKITQEIMDKGLVMVYYSVAGVVYQLNYSDSYGSNYQFALNVGKIRLQSNFDAVSNNYPVRYIIIPGGVSVNGKMAQPNYESMTYSQVCQSLQIPE